MANNSKLVVGYITGAIFDATLSKKDPNRMNLAGRRERTDEVIRAMAEHMKAKADDNEENPGYWSYNFPGIGRLSWQSEKDGDGNDGKKDNNISMP